MNQPLLEGAVGMIDALGVRGIWRGTDGQEDTRALSTLNLAVETALGMKRYEQALIRDKFVPEFRVKPDVTVLALSDTIVVAALAPEGARVTAALRWGLVDLVCQCVAYVMRKAAEGAPPLTYRGVVNFGRLLIKGPCLVFQTFGLYGLGVRRSASGINQRKAPSAAP